MELNKEYLFTTSDLVDIYMGDSYWYIAQGFYGIYKLYSIKCVSYHDVKKGLFQYALRENAEHHLKQYK